MKKRVLLISSLVVILAAAIIISISLLKPGGKDSSENILEGIFASKPMDQVTLTFHYPGEEPKSTREMLDEIQKQTKPNLNVKLDFVFHSWQTFESDMNTILASNDPCDGFFIYEGIMKKDNVRSYARKGLLKDITELLPKYALSFYQKLKPAEITAATVDGKLAALPARFKSFKRPSFIVRADLMEKYNIPDIRSIDDFEEYLRTIKEKEPAICPLASYRTTLDFFSAINGYAILDDSLGLVYKWDDKDIKIKAWELTPEFRESVNTINNWIDKGYLSLDVPVVYPDDSTITSKLFASFIGNQGTNAYYNNLLKSKNITDRSFKEYPLYTGVHAQRVDPMLECFVFTEKSQNIERALMFVNWLESEQQNYDLLMFGIKGKNYTLEGEKVSIPAGTEPQDTYNNWIWRNPFINADFERMQAGISEEYHKAYLDDYENNSEYAPHTGFIMDRTELDSVASDRELKLYQMEDSLRKGTLKGAALDDYIRSAGESGLNNLVRQVQIQIDSWLSSKNK